MMLWATPVLQKIISSLMKCTTQPVLFPVLVTPLITDIVATSSSVFARWEWMGETTIGYEVRKPTGDEHGKQYTTRCTPDFLVLSILPQVVLGDVVGSFAVVEGQLADRAEIGLLGSGGQAMQLHVFEHALA